MTNTAKLSRDEEREHNHNETGRCAFEAIKEMVDALPDWEAAAIEEGWEGPHKDKFGATYFQDINDKQTWACADWKALCVAFDIDPSPYRAEAAEQTIQEDPLSVMVRDGWHAPGQQSEDGPEEYEILLSTGRVSSRRL